MEHEGQLVVRVVRAMRAVKVVEVVRAVRAVKVVEVVRAVRVVRLLFRGGLCCPAKRVLTSSAASRCSCGRGHAPDTRRQGRLRAYYPM